MATCPLIELTRNRLKDILLRHLPKPGIYPTPIKDVAIIWQDSARVSDHRFERPLAALMIQGNKNLLIGKTEHQFAEGQSMVVAIDMPSASLLMDATRDKPLLSMLFYLNWQILADLVRYMGHITTSSCHEENGVSIMAADAEFMEGMLRLATLLDKPERIEILAPLMLKELHSLILVGQHGKVLADWYLCGGANRKILEAVSWLKNHLDVQVRSPDLAAAMNMSESNLYRIFKKLTGFSPLQYHKQLRLYEARRLMRADNLSAAQAALAIGFESTSQFNREYKRLFGQPPHRDTKNR